MTGGGESRSSVRRRRVWARAGMAVEAAAKAETAVARKGPAVLAEAVAEGRRALCSLRTNRQAEQSEWLPV